MKKIILILAAAALSACTAMYFPTSSAYSRNSIYYASVEEVNTTVSDTLVLDNESYEAKLHKFDSPTYTIELNLTPWYPSYYWRWNAWSVSPYIYTSIYWDWSWRPYYYYDYWGYYNPYRYSYRYYYPYRYSHYWDWHRPYYTYHHHKPSHRPGRDVYYTRRGGMSGPTPSYRTGSSNRSNRTVYRPSSSRPRQTTSSRDNNPTRRVTVSRSGSQPRQATTSRKTNVRYNSSARPVSRSQSQADRTGYGRSTTSTVRRSGTDYSRTSHQQSRPSERYTPQRSNTGYSGNRSHSSSGSSTRRK